MVLTLGVQALVLVRDSAAGLDVLPVTAVIGIVAWAIGMYVTTRTTKRRGSGRRRRPRGRAPLSHGAGGQVMGARLFEGDPPLRRRGRAWCWRLWGSTSWSRTSTRTARDIRIDSHSWLLVPVWLAAVLPLLWWRRNPLAAAVLVTVVMAVHVLAFGWVARCGSGLPLAWVVAFLVGTRDSVRRSLGRPRRGRGAGGPGPGPRLRGRAGPPPVRDGAERWASGASAGWPGSGPSSPTSSAARTEELAELRDLRAEVEVTDDRARMSTELDSLLHERLGQLSRAASTVVRGRWTPTPPVP